MIDLLPSDEQRQIVASVAEFASRELSIKRLWTSARGGARIGADLWRDIAELGWFGLGLPSERGGAGCTLIEEMLVTRELARHVSSPGVLATMIGAHVADEAGLHELRDDIIQGRLRVALANPIDDRAGLYHLFDAADDAMLLTWTQVDCKLFASSAFRERVPIAAIDDSVMAERARNLDKPIASLPVTKSALARRATLLVAAELVGISEAARDQAVEYAKVREQFGQPIGAFQALKHRCADMAVQAEIAYAQTFLAGLFELHEQADSLFQGAAARVLAGGAALGNASAAIQIHGAIGFTWDCDVHWLLKRAHLLRQLGGPPAAFRRLLRDHGPALAA
jgi:alkylation response protein AidB-like acyl-CoA dehydrogenase